MSERVIPIKYNVVSRKQKTALGDLVTTRKYYSEGCLRLLREDVTIEWPQPEPIRLAKDI